MKDKQNLQHHASRCCRLAS